MDVCPHCHRRLLSHISTRCNWCGVEIEDPAYLAQAEVERAASRAEDALHSLQSLTISPVTGNYSRFREVNALFGLPPLGQQDDASTLARRTEYQAWSVPGGPQQSAHSSRSRPRRHRRKKRPPRSLGPGRTTGSDIWNHRP